MYESNEKVHYIHCNHIHIFSISRIWLIYTISNNRIYIYREIQLSSIKNWWQMVHTADSHVASQHSSKGKPRLRPVDIAFVPTGPSAMGSFHPYKALHKS